MAKKITDQEIKHLELIQGAVNRFAANSFQMKGWMLVVATALLGSFANTGNKNFVLLALFPTVVFWFLDAYYLQQERKFRGVYEDVSGNSKDPKPVQPFAMPIGQYEGGKYSLWDVFTSITIFTLYGSIIVILLAIYFFL
ncbi:MAG: hypothetical protein HND47_18550 [Chloroflexi bacterium]|nr:hypothetical protein [Chloroflexota bacterium]